MRCCKDESSFRFAGFFFFLHHLFPGDRSASYLASLSPLRGACMLNQDCLSLFFNAFCASPFILCLLRRIHLCLFLYWSPASGPDNAMCLPGLGGIPISAGFPGIPLCILTLYLCFPSSLSHSDRHALKSLSQMHHTHQQLLTIHPHASSEEMSMEKNF